MNNHWAQDPVWNASRARNAAIYAKRHAVDNTGPSEYDFGHEEPVTASEMLQEQHPTTLEGQRVRLLATPTGWTRLRAGDEGTVRFVDSAGMVCVDWDNGSKMSLLPARDLWETL